MCNTGDTDTVRGCLDRGDDVNKMVSFTHGMTGITPLMVCGEVPGVRLDPSHSASCRLFFFTRPYGQYQLDSVDQLLLDLLLLAVHELLLGLEVPLLLDHLGLGGPCGGVCKQEQ